MKYGAVSILRVPNVRAFVSSIQGHVDKVVLIQLQGRICDFLTIKLKIVFYYYYTVKYCIRRMYKHNVYIIIWAYRGSYVLNCRKECSPSFSAIQINLGPVHL